MHTTSLPLSNVEIQVLDICMTQCDTIYYKHNVQTTYTRLWAPANYAPKMDFKRSVNMSSNFSQMLNYQGLWPSVFWDHYWKRWRVTNTWLLCTTVSYNSPASFPPGKSRWSILWLSSSTIAYCLAFQTIYWPIMTSSFSANVLRRYASSPCSRSWQPQHIMHRKTVKSSSLAGILHPYVPEHQEDWDKYVQPLTYF